MAVRLNEDAEVVKAVKEGLERTGGEKYEQYLSVLREVQKMEGSVYGKRG